MSRQGGAGGLRLLAQDAEDLAVISAALQDAVARVGDIILAPGGRSLTLALNRFRWEAGGRKGAQRGERVRTGLQINDVLAVKSQRLRRDAPDAVVSVLSLDFEPGEAPGGVIVLTLSGGGQLRLTVDCVDAVLADVSQPWPTPRRPVHED
ncbi:MAG: DUF2948 family protein [Caulobacter sp.]|jgi:hypothetical protein|nr:DUF2948 family protein [Caulobacter sp.]